MEVSAEPARPSLTEVEVFAEPGSSSLTGYEDAITQSMAGPSSSTTPAYAETHDDVTFLVCKIPFLDEIMYSVDAETQLRWQHRLNSAIDDIKRDVPFWKVDVAGDLLQFVAGTVGADPYHANTMVHVARRLMKMTRDPKLRLPGGRPFRLAMGMDSGSVASGIIGTIAWKYGIFGGPVTFANTLVEASACGFLRVSEATYSKLVFSSEGERALWEDGGMVRMIDDLYSPTYLLRDTSTLPEVTPDEMRAAYESINRAWTDTGPSTSALRDPTTETLFANFFQRHSSPTTDVHCMIGLIGVSCLSGVAYMLAWWWGLPNLAPALDSTVFGAQGLMGLPSLSTALLAGLWMTCLFGISVGEQNPRMYTEAYRTGVIIMIRTLLAIHHLAYLLAFIPRAAVHILPAALPDWSSVADAAREWEATCSNPDTAPAWTRAEVSWLPRAFHQNLQLLVAFSIPLVFRMMENTAIAAGEITETLSHVATAFLGGLIADPALDDGGFGGPWVASISDSISSVFLALPLALISVLLPLRRNMNMLNPLGWLPICFALLSELVLVCSPSAWPAVGPEASSYCQIAVTALVGWLIPSAMQYYWHERPLLDKFFAAIA